MEDNLNRASYRGESLLQFENLDEQFRDWVKWLKSIEASFSASKVSRTLQSRTSSRKFASHHGSQWENGWFWRDVGGESGEAV